jgi:hypothetical protein
MKYKKTYVEVTARFDTEGRILPLKIMWRDGSSFFIDKVLDIRPAASLKAGGAGIRYTCRVNQKETYLFLEENRWFVEEIIKE